jgi:beta-lactamase class A
MNLKINSDNKYSIKHILFISFTFAILSYFITNYFKEKQFNEKLAYNSSTYANDYNIKRLDGYKFIRPLMFVDDLYDSEQLNDLRQNLTAIIDKYKTVGDINNASVYLREYSNNYSFTINNDIKYDPGSLFKVPVLITILKMNELNPGFLNKTINYSESINAGKKVAFADKSIQLGKNYTVRELLTYMIKYSDNNATILLEKNMDSIILQKLFKDIGLAIPNIYASQYQFTVKDFSFFMRAIYNASYLTVENSEYAAELLSESNFKEGILKGLPPKTRVAHKFGEAGNQIEKQLHESAIVYLNNKCYLLTVMTIGKENSKLSQVISEISQVVYNNMKNEEMSMM